MVWVQPLLSSSSSSFNSLSVPQMVNALIIRSCDYLGQWSCSYLLSLEIKLRHKHSDVVCHSAAPGRLQWEENIYKHQGSYALCQVLEADQIFPKPRRGS